MVTTKTTPEEDKDSTAGQDRDDSPNGQFAPRGPQLRLQSSKVFFSPQIKDHSDRVTRLGRTHDKSSDLLNEEGAAAEAPDAKKTSPAYKRRECLRLI